MRPAPRPTRRAGAAARLAHRRDSGTRRDRRSRRSGRAPLSGSPASPTATAWFRRTTGDGSSSTSAAYAATIVARVGVLRVRGRDHGLELVRARPAERRGPVEKPHTVGDRRCVPERPILVGEQDDVAGSSTRASRRESLSSSSASSPNASASSGIRTQRSFARRIASAQSSCRTVSSPERRRVPLVEDEVDDPENAREPIGEQLRRRHAKRDPGLADPSLCPDEPLRQSRLGDEECPRDLGRRQPSDLAERQRDLRVERERGMAARECQREPLVGDRVHVVLLGWELVEPGEQSLPCAGRSARAGAGRSRGCGRW